MDKTKTRGTDMNELTLVQTDGSDGYEVPAQPDKEPKGWFFTFNRDHYVVSNRLVDRYVVIPMANRHQARARMIDKCGKTFASQLPISQLREVSHKFNLSPIGLSDIANNGGVKRFS